MARKPNQEVVVESGTEYDIDVIIKLIKGLAGFQNIPLGPFNVERLRAVLSNFNNPNYPKVHVLVAKTDAGDVAAFTTFNVSQWHSHGDSYFSSFMGDIYTFPEFRDRNIGAQLLREAAARTVKMSKEPWVLKGMFLRVLASNSKGIRFYQRYGADITATISEVDGFQWKEMFFPMEVLRELAISPTE